jgi:ATP-dependent RNA helicase SUPV3L1/SUV3
VPQPSAKSASDISSLDALTGGAFSAATSGERAARLREWLASEPTAEHMQEVYKELSVKDKGAARPLREKLDELKRMRNQAVIAEEWASKAQLLLAAERLNIADAMAWQRDAAKAGAPLSREPLAGLRNQLNERIKSIEDVQTRSQIQREAAVLLAQRIEILSTKSWRDAQVVQDGLASDVAQWQQQADALATDPQWNNIDAKFPLQLDASRQQLVAVWEAFVSALQLTAAAAADASAALPPVPVWADEIRRERGETVAAAAPISGDKPARSGKPERLADPGACVVADRAVQDAAAKVQQAVADGQGKSTPKAASDLRHALKEFGRHISKPVEAEAHAALAAAGELEDWQRWRADQLREELVQRAEVLFERAPASAEQPAAPAQPRLAGRKMQDSLRKLREDWKQVDQGGPANHALWKRFDEACNEAHKVVEAWLEKTKAETEALKSQRLALIDEVKAWIEQHSQSEDWKTINRQLHGFSERWRQAGHLSEKLYEQLQAQWKEVIALAHGPLDAAQKASIEVRKSLIAEAGELGQAVQLRVDAVKALQQRWQAEAQRVPLDRRQEQRLWDTFRKPIDEAFNRKSAEREKAAAALSEVDRRVIEAAKALETANASGDAQRIREALAELDVATRGQQAAQSQAQAAAQNEAVPAAAAAPTESAQELDTGAAAADEDSSVSAKPAVAARKPVVAVRGDDRPGTRKAEAVPLGRHGERGGKPAHGRDERRGGRDGERDFRAGRRDERAHAGDDRAARGPRLSTAAFHASRDAVEHAQQALRKLAAQAHGEVVTQVLSAWAARDGAQLPSAQQLGSRVSSATRSQWQQAVAAGVVQSDAAAEALLRLEMAAEVPTPASELDARRALQLKLLTRRNDPAPAQTWAQDITQVLSASHDDAAARRLQSVLKALLRK